MFPGPRMGGGGDADVLFRAQCSSVIYSQPFDQTGNSAFIVALWQKEPVCPVMSMGITKIGSFTICPRRAGREVLTWALGFNTGHNPTTWPPNKTIVYSWKVLIYIKELLKGESESFNSDRKQITNKVSSFSEQMQRRVDGIDSGSFLGNWSSLFPWQVS